jgi:hypothetical protein
MNNTDKKYTELLTFIEYAKLKGISLKTVYNHVKAGNIIPVIIGKAKFIKHENK